MPGLTTVFNFGKNTTPDPIYMEQDYTSDFGILKNWSSSDIVNKIKFFLPHWINSESGTNTEKLLQTIVDHDLQLEQNPELGHSGLKYLFNLLKELIRDIFIGSAINDGLTKLGIEYAQLTKRLNEHDWYLRYRILEKIYKMKPNRSNVERLILKWLGNESIVKYGIDSNFVETIQRCELPETYHYYVHNQFFKDIIIKKNNLELIRNVDYREVGKLNRRSRIIDFIKPVYPSDDIKIEIINHNPKKKINITGNDLTPINLYKFNLPVSHKYIVGSNEDINLKVYKNGQMLRRFDDYLEIGDETKPSQTIYIYNEPLDTDEFEFVIMGHANSEGYHMINSKHHILEANEYGIYGGASYICTSDDDLNIGDLVSVDIVEHIAEYANADININKPANGIVQKIAYHGDEKKYVVQTQGNMINYQRNDDRTYEWNWGIGDTLYLDVINGGITNIAPTPPDLVQVIGIAVSPNEIKLDPNLNSDDRIINTFYNSPTGKFNKTALVYIIIKNAINFGANFYNFKPQTAYAGLGYPSLYIAGHDDNNLRKLCLYFVSKTAGIPSSDTTITIKDGSVQDTKTIIINEGQPNQETYNDLTMNETLPSEYIVDVINSSSSLVNVTRMGNINSDFLPDNVSGKILKFNKDCYFLGTEANATQPGIAFYGLGNEVLFNGITFDSELDNLMKEIKYSKPAGIHVVFELHPKDLEYKENRNI